MARETGVIPQVESYQRLKKWYFIPPCLTLSIIRYGSRVKWSNPWKGVEPSRTPQCSSYWKGSLRVTLGYSRQLYLIIWQKHLYLNKKKTMDRHYIYMCVCVCVCVWSSEWERKRKMERVGDFCPSTISYCFLPL